VLSDRSVGAEDHRLRLDRQVRLTDRAPLPDDPYL